MDIVQVRDYCLSIPKVTEDSPFGDDFIVFRIANKIFCCLPLERNAQVVLKCDPDYSEELRARYSSIEPAWHWNKRHWIQINLLGTDINDELVCQLIHQAYNIVVKKLTRAQRASLE